MIKVLVVEDEKGIRDILELYLKSEGYECLLLDNPLDAIEQFTQFSPDIAILDVMMPHMNGFELLEHIRKISQIPVIMLTAKTDEISRIKGLDKGADDYVIKPFSPKELLARLRANLRRTSPNNELILFDEKVRIDFEKREYIINNEVIKLTKTEFDIVRFFCSNKNKVISREQLIDGVFGINFDGYDRTIDVHIKNLRAKIEKDEIKAIETVYGIGYRWLG
jgi:DNA-binding response OmpR family regulator